MMHSDRNEGISKHITWFCIAFFHRLGGSGIKTLLSFQRFAERAIMTVMAHLINSKHKACHVNMYECSTCTSCEALCKAARWLWLTWILANMEERIFRITQLMTLVRGSKKTQKRQKNIYYWLEIKVERIWMNACE